MKYQFKFNNYVAHPFSMWNFPSRNQNPLCTNKFFLGYYSRLNDAESRNCFQ